MGPTVKRLLILDDDEGISALLRTIAEGEGFAVRSTTNPGDFFVEQASWLPTHIIVDLKLRSGDGIEVLKALALRGCDSRVVVTSGLGLRVLEAAEKVASENGLQICGVLSKPFKVEQVRYLLEISPYVRAKFGATASPTPPRISSAEFMELSRAIDAGELVPFFQPKIQCRDNRPVGFECLARWLRPSKGMVMPDHFIPLAERSGLIEPLSQKIFEQAIDWFARFFSGTEATLALNMSPVLLRDQTFLLWLEEQCRQQGLRPDKLILEITETTQLDNPGKLLELFTQLRIKGFHLSIDDFGVGYSSLTQLARLPFSEMKIDKTFIIDAARSQESQKIASALVGLARALGLSVTAEGVEDEWTLNYLQDIGCDRAQGYYIARPLDSDAAKAWYDLALERAAAGS